MRRDDRGSMQLARETGSWHGARQIKKAIYGSAFAASLSLVLRRPFRLQVVLGLRRSGNHLFVNWYASQCYGPVFFFNNVNPKEIPTNRHRREFFCNNPFCVPTLLFSYEDRGPTDVADGGLQDFRSRFRNKIIDMEATIVIRDLRNLLASRFRKWPEQFDDCARVEQLLERYDCYLRLATSGNFQAIGSRVVPVYYDSLVCSRAYRDRLSRRLEIREGSRGLDQIKNYGHGSSFDPSHADRKAAHMDVTSRWRYFADEPRFQNILRKKEVNVLQKRFEEALSGA